MMRDDATAVEHITVPGDVAVDRGGVRAQIDDIYGFGDPAKLLNMAVHVGERLHDELDISLNKRKCRLIARD